MQLHLICNGMMLFWYRPAHNGRPDGYRILIPQSPVDSDGMQMHELRLGTQPGANPSSLHYAPTPRPTEYFELQFGYGPSLKTRAMKSCDYNVMLYGSNGRKAQPDYGGDEPAGVGIVIDIPYPDTEEGARFESFAPNPYPYLQSGSCAPDFNVRPRQIPRCNVFTWGIVNPELPVTLQNRRVDEDRRFLVHDPVQGDVKLYLYSGPPKFPTAMINHLEAFNQMLKYKGQCLDLKRDPKAKPTCTQLDSVVPPAGVTRDDLKHLCEINGYMDMCTAQSRGIVNEFSIDPAECVQGGGC